MSLVRYNTSGSLETVEKNRTDNDNNDDDNANNNLSVVYKNRVSNEMVLYDSNSKEFQIVQMKSPKLQPTYIDYNMNTNDIVRGPKLKRHSISYKRERMHSQNNKPEHMHYSQSKTFACSVCGAYNRVYFDNETDNDLSESDSDDSGISNTSYSTLQLTKAITNDSVFNFTSTGEGNYIRRDYFKLLTSTMANNDKFEGLLTDGTENDNNAEPISNQSDDYSFHMIPENMINQGYFNKFFKILSKLGTGSFGAVYKVEHDLLGLNLGVFALKKIAIGDDINNLKKILNEVKFLYDLSCNFSDTNNNNNVVKYNHVWVEIDQVSRFSPKVPVVFLLFEYCDGGTLEEWVDSIIHPKHSIAQEKLWRKLKAKKHKARYLNNFEIFKIFNDITQGLNYLHNLKILHRDLKPSNCLFKTKFERNYQDHPVNSLNEMDGIPTLLVSDFGESVMVNSIEENWQNSIETTGNTGTLEFCAPEIILQRKKLHPKSNKFGGFSYASDVYSLGMILYYLCFGKLPFNNTKYDPEEISNEILSLGLFENLSEIRPVINNINYNNVSPNNEDAGILVDWIELIEVMVSKTPDDRPTCPEILSSLLMISEKLANVEPPMGPDGDDENDSDYIYKSDSESESDTEDSLDKKMYDVSPISKLFFSNTVYNELTMMIIMFLINIVIFNSLSRIYSTSVIPLLMNLQFLFLGLYIGGCPFKQLPLVEIISTIVIVVFYIVISLL